MIVATFLFTDIEGSTPRWEADADAMRVALEAHDAVLHECVEKHAGHVFKHTGDGVCAVFASPGHAVDAAVAAQRALELPVRMGLATGEAEVRDGDYFGAVLNRAARVMAAGHGGQILLDGMTADLVSDADLMSMGSRHLRGIAKPVDISQLRAEGLRVEFPPLKTMDTTPGNLRPPATSLIGRHAELADLQTALKAHRLVTLTGVGGVGKTRLALEVGARSAPAFPDGVFVIELAALSDPAAVPEAVAAALGITRQPGMSLASSIATALEGRLRLLIFDNCEHVLDAAAEIIDAILSCSSTVRILATSREGVRVADEQLWPVPSLDTGLDSSATTLFIERAAAVAPGISLTAAGDTVAEICRRLDGIPLGIELAASRMQSMTVEEIRHRLDDRFRLLVGSRRGLERHQTLRHAVQWSYDLLDESEKALLQRCSVFAGGFDLAGACAVSGSRDEYSTLDLLDALVRKSLLVVDRSTERTRFSMLETIRRFAEAQLAESDETDAARTAHAQFFAGHEADVLALWDSSLQREAYDWFNREFPNLRVAFRWAVDKDDLDSAAAIAITCAYLGVWLEQSEPVSWVEELIVPARRVGHRRLAHLYVMAAQCYATGRVDDSLAYAQAAFEAIESGEFDAVAYIFEATLGGPFIAKGDLAGWVALSRKILMRWPEAHTCATARLVLALVVAGEIDEAIDLSATLPAELPENPHTAGLTLQAYGCARRESDPVSAYDAFRRGLSVARDSGNRQMESNIAINMSRLATDRGNYAEVFDNLTSSIRIHLDAGSFSHLPQPLAVLTTALDRLGRYQPAATISGFAATTTTKAAFPEVVVSVDHLREVHGDNDYTALAATGSAMGNTAMTAYALDQIDQARAGLPRGLGKTNY